MFQGSKHTPPDSHFPMLEAAGATDINGTTDYDRTNYFETVPSNQLELALWIESDRMGYLLDTVDQAALSNQQDVVRNERRQSVENRPYGIAEEAVVQLLYPKGHPYYASVIGSHEDIQAVKLDDVKQFFKRYYAPNNASLAIVGDVDPAQVRPLVEKYFGSLKRGADVPPISAETPKITSERRKVVEDRDRAAARLHGVADAADLQAGRRRRGHRRRHPRRRPLEPAVQEARLRKADRAGRERRAAVADSRLAVPDPGDRASGPHGGGARAGDRRGARRASRDAARRRREIERARNTIETQHHLAPRGSRRLRRRRRSAEPVQPLPRTRPTICRRTSSATAR